MLIFASLVVMFQGIMLARQQIQINKLTKKQDQMSALLVDKPVDDDGRYLGAYVAGQAPQIVEQLRSSIRNQG